MGFRGPRVYSRPARSVKQQPGEHLPTGCCISICPSDALTTYLTTTGDRRASCRAGRAGKEQPLDPDCQHAGHHNAYNCTKNVLCDMVLAEELLDHPDGARSQHIASADGAIDQEVQQPNMHATL